MSALIDLLALYLHLARASQRPLVRDRLLVIAGCNAARMKLNRIDEYCRRLILGFVSKPVAEVAKTSDKPRNSELLASSATKKRSSRSVLRQSLEHNPQHTISRWPSFSAAIEERDTYYSDEEYAATILGITPDGLGSA